MKFGHHGGNHLVKDIDNNTVMITAQNHGFAVDEASMPANLRVTHKSLFDGTLQGIHRTDKPAFSFQGHPEASPAHTTPRRCSITSSNLSSNTVRQLNNQEPRRQCQNVQT